MGVGELVIRLRQAVVLHLADVHLQQQRHDREADPGRDPLGPAELVDRLAEEVLGDHIGPAAGGQIGVLRVVGGIDGDVHRRVAHAEDDDVLAGDLGLLLVVVGVHLLAGEVLAARKRRLRPARVPVMPVGDDHGVVGRRLAVAGADLEPPVGQALDVLDPDPEPDPVAEAEVVDVVVEVLGDVVVTGEVGIGLRHREVRELHALAGGVDVQRSVGGRDPVVVAEDPVPADPVAELEAVERQPALVQGLGRGDSAGAGADQTGNGCVVGHRLSSRGSGRLPRRGLRR